MLNYNARLDIWLTEYCYDREGWLCSAQSQIMGKLTNIFERTLILQALRHTGGRRIEAAIRLGIGRNTLTRKIQELGLDDQEPPNN
jgi:two-component system, NtrC family, nitrogen regulation response regulator GlnG